MEKNTAWAIGLSSVVLIGFFFLQTYFMPKPQPVTQKNETTAVEAAAENSESIEKNIPEKIGIVNSQNSDSLAEENFTLETNKVKVTFTNRGGDIISYELKDHIDSDTNGFIQMADNITDSNRAFAISIGGAENSIVNDIFVSKKIDDNKIGFFKNYVVNNPDGNESGFKSMTINGKELDSNYIPADILEDTNEIILNM